jgi:hypothetical protein
VLSSNFDEKVGLHFFDASLEQEVGQVGIG